MTATVFDTPDEALEGIADGARVMVGGFVSAGTPTNLILALKRRGTRDITLIANNLGFGDRLDELCEGRQVSKAITTFAVRASTGRESNFEAQYRRGEIELELVPQGTFAERIRAGGAGIGGFLTRTGVGTQVAEGKEVLSWEGEEWLLERPLRADVALLKAHRADRLGNLTYRLAGQKLQPHDGDGSGPRDRGGGGDRRDGGARARGHTHARAVRRPDRALRPRGGALGWPLRGRRG